MNNFLAALGALLVVVLGAMFAVPHFVDWNQYRGVIEEETSRVLGRDFRIGGDMRLRLLPTPSFRIEQVRIADPQSASGLPLFKADTVSARLAISPLLRGALEATEIELMKPVVRLVLDQRGGGTWQSVGQSIGQSGGSGTDGVAGSYIPSNITLAQIIITDGTLTIVEPDALTERLKVGNIGGEVTAPDLRGPYKFRGTTGAGESALDVRLQANAPEADGSVRLAATLKSIVSAVQSRVEGQLKDLGGVPRFEGQFSMQAPLPRSKRHKGEAVRVDIKAELIADTKAATFDQIEVAFDSAARPQAITGQARWSWAGTGTGTGAGTGADQGNLDVKLASSWLDLDAILGIAPDTQVSPAAALFERLAELPLTSGPPAAGAVIDNSGGKRGLPRSTWRLDLQQANFGRDQIGEVLLKLSSDGRTSIVDELRMQLPGGSRVELIGSVARQGGALQFVGATRLKGGSAARLAGWASGGAVVIDPPHDGAFALDGKLRIDGGQISVQQLTGTFAASVVDGSVTYAWSERDKPDAARRLSIDLTGARIDARALLPQRLSIADLMQSLGRRGADSGKSGITAPDLTLKVRTGMLVTPGRVFRDVVIDVEATGSQLKIARMQGMTDDGARLAFDGTLAVEERDGVRRSTGKLHWSAAASDGAGLLSLGELMDVPAGLRPMPERQGVVLPFKLAGSASLGAHDAADALVLDGEGIAGQTQARFSATLNGGLKDWAKLPLHMTVDLAAPDPATAARVLGVFGGSYFGDGNNVRARPDGDALSAANAVQVSILATGIANSGLLLSVANESAGGRMTFQGRAEALERDPRLSGVVEIDATENGQVLALLPGFGQFAGQLGPIKGRTTLSLERQTLQLADIHLKRRGGNVSGTLTLAISASAPGQPTPPQSVSGRLQFDRLSGVQLLSLVSERGRTPVTAAISATMGRAGVWPEQPFNFNLGTLVGGDVVLSSRALEIGDDLALQDVTATLSVSPNGLTLKDLSGRGTGGTWTGLMKLERPTTTSAGGAQFAATLALTKGSLDTLGGTGAVAGTLQLNGSGMSPAGLVSTLSGTGTVVLGGARVTQISAQKLKLAMEKALNAEPDKLGTVLRSELDSASAVEPVTVGPRQVAISVKDGIARTQPFQAESADGKVTPQARLDLSTLVVDGEWRIDSKLQPAPVSTAPQAAGVEAAIIAPAKVLPPLPGVVVTVRLPLTALGVSQGAREISIATDALERELAVRKVERDLDELERLRLLDELKSKERTRLQKEDAARREAEAKAAIEAKTVGEVQPATTDSASQLPAAAVSEPTTQAAPAPLPPQPRPAPRPATPRGSSSEDWKRVLGAGGSGG